MFSITEHFLFYMAKNQGLQSKISSSNREEWFSNITQNDAEQIYLKTLTLLIQNQSNNITKILSIEKVIPYTVYTLEDKNDDNNIFQSNS